MNGTSVAKELNELFGRKDTFNNSFIDVSTLCTKTEHAVDLNTIKKVYDLILSLLHMQDFVKQMPHLIQ